MSTAPNVTVIPAKVQTAENRDKHHQLRVAAYCRVSTTGRSSRNSFAVQVAYYTDLINRKRNGLLQAYLQMRVSAERRQRKEQNLIV